MTIKEAVEILNRENHNGASDWHIPTPVQGALEVVISPSVAMRLSALTFFEAAVVAEAYERGFETA